ncbi:cyclin-domain-containing protein [Geopyxis carbonaria]|nr:cyclin-domain-containing protein [Geopyxis carbonaria]
MDGGRRRRRKAEGLWSEGALSQPVNDDTTLRHRATDCTTTTTTITTDTTTTIAITTTTTADTDTDTDTSTSTQHACTPPRPPASPRNAAIACPAHRSMSSLSPPTAAAPSPHLRSPHVGTPRTPSTRSPAAPPAALTPPQYVQQTPPTPSRTAAFAAAHAVGTLSAVDSQLQRGQTRKAASPPPSTASTASSATAAPDSADGASGVSSPSKRVRRAAAAPTRLPALYQHAATADLVVLIADMLAELVGLNDRIPLSGAGLTRFHSRAPPTISIADYLARLTIHASLQPSILLSMVYYIDILSTHYPPFVVSSLTVHRFLITAATVASKGLCDTFLTNGFYAKVGGVSLLELNMLELEFLVRVGWRIVPNAEVLGDYYRSLVERLAGRYVVEPAPVEEGKDGEEDKKDKDGKDGQDGKETKELTESKEGQDKKEGPKDRGESSKTDDASG